jgi:REP element-mobilizing transposase RayT
MVAALEEGPDSPWHKPWFAFSCTSSFPPKSWLTSSGPTWSEVHAYLAGIANNLDSPCLVVNGTSDHVHTLVCQSKNLALAKFVEGVKKGSSKWIKTKSAALRSFHGQDGYALFPSARRRPWRKVTSPGRQNTTARGRSRKSAFSFCANTVWNTMSVFWRATPSGS